MLIVTSPLFHPRARFFNKFLQVILDQNLLSRLILNQYLSDNFDNEHLATACKNVGLQRGWRQVIIQFLVQNWDI